MMIYTSYFAKLRNISPAIVPISICGKPPAAYHGKQLKMLAPKWSFFKIWKETHDNDFYIRHYHEEVLNKLDAKKMAAMLRSISNDKDVVLLCYEKPGDFCHRHLVAKWFREHGIPCEEFT